MNKYLLLRDNKQTGPYSVPELIEKGIKAYDLVWLEGRSAAWRYPSEIEELKAYAPAVEEQPFERFYRKPDPVIETVVADKISDKKVYVNFPKKNVVATTVERKIPQPPVAEEKPATTFAEQHFYPHANEVVATHRTTTKNTQPDKKFIYIAIAAAIILGAFITVLLINNSRQQQRLQELNTLVKQIETKKAAGNTPAVVTVKNETPAHPQTSETIVNPELLNLDDHNAPAPTSSHPSNATPPVATKKTPPASSNNSSVVFTERPVLRRGDNNAADPAAAPIEKPVAADASSANLYKLVDVSYNKYKTGMLGGISNLQLQLTNNSNRELQKVAIQINYLGPEKKVVNTQTVYFENVSPGAHSTIDVPKSKRGVSISYTITDIKS